MEFTEEMLKYELPSSFRILEQDRWMATIDNCVHHYKGACRGVFIDIGSHVGVVGTRAITAGFSSVYCYEPCSNNFQNLVFNLKLMERNTCISQAYNLAVTNKTGESFTLYKLASRGTPNSGMRSGYYAPKERAVDSIVGTISLLDVLKVHDRIEFLKIDIEGGEYSLFEPSFELTCLLNRVNHLSLEIHPPDDFAFYSSDNFILDNPWYSSPEAAPMELIDYLRDSGFTDMTYDQVMKTDTLEFSSDNHKLI